MLAGFSRESRTGMKTPNRVNKFSLQNVATPNKKIAIMQRSA